MSIGAAFLLNIAVVVLAVLAILLVLVWIASLVWLCWVVLTRTKSPYNRPYSTLDLIGQDLSELDRRDGLGSELL